MILIEEDDLPGVVSWWPEAVAVIVGRRRRDDGRSLDGPRKMAQRAYQKRYYEKHKPEAAEYRKAYYLKNRERMLKQANERHARLRLERAANADTSRETPTT